MPVQTKILFTILFLSLSACSTQDFKRATYGSLQELNRQQCYKELENNCEQRQSYEQYQDKRKELTTPQ